MRSRHLKRAALREHYESLLSEAEQRGFLDAPMNKIQQLQVKYSSTLRFMANVDRKATLREVLEACRDDPSASYDIEPGETLQALVKALAHNAIRSARVDTLDREWVAPSCEEIVPSDSLGKTMRELQLSLGAALENSIVSTALNAFRRRVAQIAEAGEYPSRYYGRDVSLRLAEESARSAIARAGAKQPIDYFDDIGAALKPLGDRKQRLMLQRYIAPPSDRQTLERLGVAEGVSRERIRQLVSSAEDAISAYKPPSFLLALLQAALDESGDIATSYEVWSRLPAALRPANLTEFYVPEALFQWNWLGAMTPSEVDGVWARESVDSGAVTELCKQVRQAARKQLNTWGAVSLEFLEDRVGEDAPGVAYELYARSGFGALDGWLVSQRGAESKLKRALERLRHLESSLEVRTLRTVIRRSLRGLPPDRVFTELLVRCGCSIQGDSVALPQLNANSQSLSGSEKLAIQVIGQHGGVLSLVELQRQFVRNGMSTASAGIAAIRSPLLVKLKPGLWGIVGRPPSSERLAEAKRLVRKSSTRMLLGFRNSDPSTLELRYRLDPELVGATLFVVPKGVLEPGSWTAAGREESTIEVKKGYIVGLSGRAREALAAGGRILRLRFSRKDQIVTITSEA